MNRIPGVISDIISEGHLSIVKIKAQEDMFTSIVIDTPDTAPWLQSGKAVDMVFKENEVAIGKQFSGLISMQNRFPCVLTGIETGKLLSRVEMDYKGFKIVSLITANAANTMHLATGDAVTALVKTNEITLSA